MATPLLPPTSVLIIDDQAIVRRVAGRILSDEGFRVFEAEDGLEAFDVLRFVGHVDLVIVDVVLPGVDGVAFAHTLQSWRPNQPILFMSAHPAQILATHGANLPVTFLAKPFTREELMTRVRQTLRPAPSGRQAGSPTSGSVDQR